CLVNGEILKFVPASDRGLNYGDGVFETIAVIQGRPRLWQEHMDRLAIGCERLGMEAPPQAVLLRELQTVCAGLQRCIVKIVLSRAYSGRGYSPLIGAAPERVVSSYLWQADSSNHTVTGVDAHICEIKLAIQPALGGMKHLNRLEQVLASRELDSVTEHEGILFDAEDHLISTISANIFMVYRGQVLTPRLDRSGVRGVLRSQILKVFKARCELRRISREMLDEASEVFLCSAVRGIIPIKRIDEIEYPIGPATREFQAWLAESVSVQ
ncbi:MAG: 4-amino-4-deoxychorismate lyase, partial [Lysobacterales bacterium]